MINGKPAYHPIPRKKVEKEVVMEGSFDVTAYAKPETSAEIREAARSTCQICPLFQDASTKNCRQCPLVEFLKILWRVSP